MDWIFIIEIIYAACIIAVCMRIIYDTRSTTKALAYLVLTVFLPVIGALVYFSFGINYRKRKLYSKKLTEDEKLSKRIQEAVYSFSDTSWKSAGNTVQGNKGIVRLLLKDSMSPVTGKNSVKLLINGEEKFREVLEALKAAKRHIHLEYYIFEDDEIGNQIKEVLMQKAREGLEVRFIYDDFGSRSIRKKLVPELKAAGVQALPFYRVLFLILANRLNYRNHRKIIVIDGSTAFVGGINVSDRYINRTGNDQIFWRDTHLRIDGPGIGYLQYVFLGDWNFCCDKKLGPDNAFFYDSDKICGDTLVQIAASGPDSDTPTILFSLIQAVSNAEKEILITTPYFIPGESLMDAITVAALRGVSVKILVPGISDSRFINAAARCYYDELLAVGVEIYLYQKGFVHAKTMVTDDNLSVIGTANMDHRSFELNFEVNAMIYDEVISKQLRDVFYEDLKDAVKIDPVEWENRATYKQLFEKVARLMSPLM